MKIPFGFLLLGLLMLAGVGRSEEDGHMRRHRRNIIQNLAVDRIMRDRGFVKSLINCVLEKGPCDGHGRHLKRLAPDIIRGHCPGCDRASKTHMRRVISHVQRNFPQEWTEVMNRFLRYPQQLQSVFG